MPHIAFFAHDALDAAVKRRIKAFKELGASVTGFTMRRGPAFDPPWENVDLGRTFDANFSQRLARLARAVPILARHRAALAKVDIYYARNLDMLMLARLAKGLSGGRGRVVFECLDIHRFLSRSNLVGAGLRRVERALLAGTSLVVVSSPAFCREYFEVFHPGCYRAFLIENRLPPGYAYGPREVSGPRTGNEPLRIGWFGNLRCRRSLSLLLAVAERQPDRIRIVLRGTVARTEIPDLEARIAGRANVSFGGRYDWPADLASLYGGVDLVWAGDFHDPGANSAWLLPNRLYEGGYYGVPSVAPEASETGRWIKERGFGFTVAEPLETTLPEFVGSVERCAIEESRQRLLAAGEEVFAQPKGEINDLLAAVLSAQ